MTGSSSDSVWITASGSPSVCPCCSLGNGAVRHEHRAHADRLGAVDVVEEPVADEDARGPVRRHRPRPSRPGTPPGAAWSTGSRWCRPRRRCAAARRRGRRSPRAARATTPCSTARRCAGRARAVRRTRPAPPGRGRCAGPTSSRRPGEPSSSSSTPAVCRISARLPLRCSSRLRIHTSFSAASSRAANSGSRVAACQASAGSMTCHGVNVPPQSKITASTVTAAS